MELKITGSLVLDLGDYIHAVEATAGQYMLANPQGWFLPGSCEPVLDRSKSYFYVGEVTDNVALAMPIDFNALKQEDIYNDRGDIVVVRKQIKHLTQEARYSARSRNLIVEVIDNLVRSHARWTGSQSKLQAGVKQTNLNAAVRPFLLEPLQRSGVTIDGVFQYPSDPRDPNFVWGRTGDIEHVSLDPLNALGLPRVSEKEKQLFLMSLEICDGIILQLEDLIQPLTEFLGQDRWIMHFQKVSHTAVTVEKTIDYRIYSWMMEHGRGYDD
jgi:hypothetical protein